MSSILIALYILLLLYHFVRAYNGQTYWTSVIVTFVFLAFLTLGCDFENQHDLSAYAAQYNNYDPLRDDNFAFYYIFFFSMKAAQAKGLSFETWWCLTNAISYAIIFITLKKHKYNPHLFLLFFMAYYVIILYTGLKAFYGLSIYMFGSGYLLKGGRKNKIIYIVFTLISGGIHPMYYLYLIFAFINTNFTLANSEMEDQYINKNRWVKIIVVVSLVLSIFLRISGSANQFLANIFSFIESDKLDSYLGLSTNMGFFIPVIMQLLALWISIGNEQVKSGISIKDKQHAVILKNINLLQILFYPLFMVAVTFMRLITESSLVTIMSCGYNYDRLWLRERKKILKICFVIILAYCYRQFVMGNLWEASVIPLFTNRFFNI